MKILTFDIEEWFHILDHDISKNYSNWSNLESRIHFNIDKIFQLLEYSNYSATFFVVGWIAEKYPDIIKRIDKNGFHIGSHSNMHQLCYEQSKDDFNNDLKKSISILENIIGKKVDSYRAPGFSFTEKNKWVFESLYENGIKFDCSIFPKSRAHSGFSTFPVDKPSIIKYNGVSIKEFPVNIYKSLLINYVFSGGGYFRITPYILIKKFSDNSDYIMSYFHPRDFDSSHPNIDNISLLRKFKLSVGLNSCLKKLKRWVEEYKFIDVRVADKIIDWKKADTIYL